MRHLSKLLFAIATAPLPAAQVDLADLNFVEVFRGLSNTTSITHAGDGTGRLFVTEQIGRVLIHDGESLLSTPFLDIRTRVRAGGERGLLSIAFHPSYASNGYFYLNYTDLSSNTVVSRFKVSDDPDVADPESEAVFYRATQPRRNHNGGQIHFGPDGYLYIGMGDGGGAGDPPNLAQNLSSPLGKMLRVDVAGDGPAVAPDSNPFQETDNVLPEIWAYGLRNPWRFSFDRLTGDMFIADVGQNAVEEISFQSASSTGGENYGWRLMEGSRCFNPATGCNDGSLVLPIVEYDNLGGNCGGSVTGGYRYRGAQFPQLSGVYFFADYCTGDFYGAVKGDDAWTKLGPRETALNIRTFGEDEGGEIYFADASVVYRIEAPRPPPQISSGGVVSAATFQIGSGLSPGSLASAFGVGLADSTAVAEEYPLPADLGGGSMTFDGTVAAPQVFASPGQRNFQVPWELGGLAEASLTVTVGEDTSPAVVVPLATVNPGIFVLNTSGQAAAMIASTDGVVAGPEGSFPGARPAKPGEAIEVLATGLGQVTNQPATGAAASTDPASVTVASVTARVGGEAMTVTSSGLLPSFAGIYQVKLKLADDVATGDAVPLVIRVGGVDSNTVYIAVEQEEETMVEEQQP